MWCIFSTIVTVILYATFRPRVFQVIHHPWKPWSDQRGIRENYQINSRWICITGGLHTFRDVIAWLTALSFHLTGGGFAAARKAPGKRFSVDGMIKMISALSTKIKWKKAISGYHFCFCIFLSMFLSLSPVTTPVSFLSFWTCFCLVNIHCPYFCN